jgi:cathepsin D
VSVSVSFGGQTWSISAKDLVQDPVESGACVGAFGGASPTQPSGWTVGIPFLVRTSFHFYDFHLLRSDIQRNVYSVFRETPPSIGFAQLSTIAGGTGVYHSFKLSAPWLLILHRYPECDCIHRRQLVCRLFQ